MQIYGVAKILTYKSEEYNEKRLVYDARFPTFSNMFRREKNELYQITPLIIWRYNPRYGAVNRDEYVIDSEFYEKINPYKFHSYKYRS